MYTSFCTRWMLSTVFNIISIILLFSIYIQKLGITKSESLFERTGVLTNSTKHLGVNIVYFKTKPKQTKNQKLKFEDAHKNVERAFDERPEMVKRTLKNRTTSNHTHTIKISVFSLIFLVYLLEKF